jgi:hypothetical protein
MAGMHRTGEHFVFGMKFIRGRKRELAKNRSFGCANT